MEVLQFELGRTGALWQRKAASRGVSNVLLSIPLDSWLYPHTPRDKPQVTEPDPSGTDGSLSPLSSPVPSTIPRERQSSSTLIHFEGSGLIYASIINIILV